MTITKWKLIKTIARSQKLLIGLTLLSGFTFNVFTILIPLSVGKFYEFAFGFSSQRLKAFGFVPFLDAKDPKTFFVVFFGIVALRFIFELGNRYGITLVGELFAKALREQLFTTQMDITMPIYEEKGTGKYLLRFSGDLNSIQNYVKNGLLRFFQDVLLLSIVFGFIAYIHATLALLIFCAVGVAALLLWSLNKVLYRQSLERRNRKSGLLSFVNTRLRGITTLKAFNKYTPERKRFYKRSEKVYRIGKKYARTVSFLQAVIPAMTYCLLGAIMGYVLYAPANTDVVGGSSLLVVILLILAIIPVLRRTLRVNIVWRLGSISFDKLILIFQLPKENELPGEERFTDNVPIKFENVTYAYGHSPVPVFKDLQLEIKPRTTTLLYGPSGCGKSTLVKLLLKSVSPQKGALMLGHNSYNSLSEKTIRKHIAVVSKEYPLYGKDVFEAVAYSRNKARKQRILKLLQELQQYEAPKDRLNLNDPIGDLGTRLNSGQTKLLMYCRALLTDKPILVIEDPFEYLSPKTTQLISDKLTFLQHQKTVIILAHLALPGLKQDQVYKLNSVVNYSASQELGCTRAYFIR